MAVFKTLADILSDAAKRVVRNAQFEKVVRRQLFQGASSSIKDFAYKTADDYVKQLTEQGFFESGGLYKVVRGVGGFFGFGPAIDYLAQSVKQGQLIKEGLLPKSFEFGGKTINIRRQILESTLGQTPGRIAFNIIGRPVLYIGGWKQLGAVYGAGLGFMASTVNFQGQYSAERYFGW